MTELEIERKFLIRELPKGLDLERSEKIQQGYIALTPDSREVRVRRKGEYCYITVKVGKGLTREETEVILSEQQFAALWPTTQLFQLEKTRHFLDYADHTIEIDQYEGKLAPLLVAEVEFKSIEDSENFVQPKWFSREITDDLTFSNYNLASGGLTDALKAVIEEIE